MNLLQYSLKEVFEKHHLEIKQKLEDVVPDIEFMYAGTISFIIYDVFQRPPKDLDIVVSPEDFQKLEKALTLVESNSEGENFTFKALGMNVDVFAQQKLKQPLEFKEKIISQSKIKAQHPKYSVKAKIEFLNNYIDYLKEGNVLTDRIKKGIIKHSDDVSKYNEWKAKKVRSKSNISKNPTS